MPLIIQKQWYTKEEIQCNPDKIYVFGDNEVRKGNGGQAKACRGEPNTIGIRTKALPWPADGVGTGLANLATNAPRTLAVIKFLTKFLIDKYS
jgi:hypothetical protein